MIDEGADDLAERVIPLVRPLVADGHVAVGVGARGLADERTLLLEVGVLDAQPVVGERPRQGVGVVDVEAPTGPHDHPYLFCPTLDARQPAQRAQAHVGDVERLPAQGIRRVLHVGAHERRSIAEACLLRQFAGLADCRRREVDAGDGRAGARPRQRVEPEMALQVDDAQPRDVAESRNLPLSGTGLFAQPPLDVVEVRPHVDGDALVPVDAVRRASVLLGSSD